MKLKVERVNPSGKSFLSGGAIYKKGKGLNAADFNAFAGKEVEIEADADGWVTKISPVAETTKTKTEETTASTGGANLRYTSAVDQDRIARLSVLSSVLASPAFAAILQHTDISKTAAELDGLVQHYTEYALTGKFKVQELEHVA